MPPFWQGLNSLNLSMASTRSPSGIFSRASNVAGVLDLVDVDLDGAAGRPQVLRGVVHVIPADGIVEPAHHVDAVRRDDEVTVVEIVLLGRKDA